MTTFSELIATWDSIKAPLEKNPLKNDEISEFIEENINLQNINTHAITAVDLRTNKYLYVDNRIEQVTGYSRSEYLKSGPKIMFSKIPLSHKIGVIRTTLHQNRLVSSSSKEEIKDLIINREINILDKNRVSRRILHQVLEHIYDDKGKIQAVVSLQTQIGHLSAATNFKYYLFSRKLNTITYPKPKQNSKGLFTPREQEIILLVSQGLSSEQIAKQFFLSIHTVKTHRKNILRKSNASNFLQLINSLDFEV